MKMRSVEIGLFVLLIFLGSNAAADNNVTAACEAIASIIEGVPGGKVIRFNGPFEDTFGNSYRTGCSVNVKGTFSALHGTPHAEDRLLGPLEGRGWKQDNQYASDGMDGTSFGMRKGPVLCVVSGRWDGGDDDDPNSVPGDWYEVSIGCTSDANTSRGKSP